MNLSHDSESSFLTTETLPGFKQSVQLQLFSTALPFEKHYKAEHAACHVLMTVSLGLVRVYVWTDDHGRKLKCSAPLYFDYAMSYIQDLLTDEDVFPTKAGKSHLI